LPLTVLLLIVTVAKPETPKVLMPPPGPSAALPLSVLLLIVSVANGRTVAVHAAAGELGGIVAQRAVVERKRCEACGTYVADAAAAAG
jgi:NADPH-dependent curcumin reductase CurA